ncbi:GTP cyclohydrolase II [Paenibacillus cellulosilyticus]|uniref:GTP cyclohydrolase II n=1 Tax=Paenibacillus cellulosilyticus TaxID=375489 RepID=A0A2V2YKX8_9BACL|nr:GTP cyclohydrolase II [Paenibacillus cellulosilyticus]PWV94262.1 GTP cyclohydrolase II [Paenibacillus cellulosilyticus]QKS44249.1 GTP cyclohydrolase II [Paenibacillus cellulosilyticus]
MHTIQTDIISILKRKITTVPSGDKMIYLVGPVRLPVSLGGETHIFQWYCWLRCDKMAGDTCQDEPQSTEQIISRLSASNLAEMQQSSVLVYGDFANAPDALIRMHSICHTGDIFGSKRCDCGYQLEQSMKMIVKHGNGALFYLANHEGRGIGLFSKAMAYVLQEEGYDTVDANLQLGFQDDIRSYDDAIQVLKELRSKPVTLITNNPRKLDALVASGADVSGRVPLWGDVSEFNKRYLETKVRRSGHFDSSSRTNPSS